ncbi:L,D-transpeptidase [Mycobacterium sp.]|uniref:L,D-transpeptidase n=1 Tax=Mycobacterium sp. TaxID=1785 RepID=UPI0025ED8710|nr:L,D-transpeptidase [Mycobacterium sp.]
MRAVFRSVLVAAGTAASVVAGPSGVSLAASDQSTRFPVASLGPIAGQVGVAYPVAVTFRSPVIDRKAAERAVHVNSSPAMSGKLEWINDTAAQWVPEHFWPAHSTIALSVGGASAEMKTGPAVLGVADISDHTFTVSVDGVPSGPSQQLPAPHHQPHLGEPGVMPASMGRPHFPTPAGLYTVLSKDRTVIMDSSSVGVPVTDPEGYKTPVEYATRISNRGLFVHSAPWATQALGHENVSHGCISLSPADAEWYFNTVNIGDPVVVKE